MKTDVEKQFVGNKFESDFKIKLQYMTTLLSQAKKLKQVLDVKYIDNANLEKVVKKMVPKDPLSM